MASAGPSTCGACGDSGSTCVFAKALLAHSAVCDRAQRRSLGEREIVECGSMPARINCATLAALMHERARFALRLPGPGQPMFHAQALRLQCGGLQALRQALVVERADVHAMVGAAQERYGGLMQLPWEAIVRDIAAWQPQRRRRAPSR